MHDGCPGGGLRGLKGVATGTGFFGTGEDDAQGLLESAWAAR